MYTEKKIARVIGGETWNSGGGVWLVDKELESGRIVCISDEVACLYDSQAKFEEGAASLTFDLDHTRGEVRYSNKLSDYLQNSELQSVKTDFDTTERFAKKALAVYLWEKLGDIPVNDEGDLDEPFLEAWEGKPLFEVGTDREDIWRWFEDEFDVLVAEDLMGFNDRDEGPNDGPRM